jgi:hypothetical protein
LIPIRFGGLARLLPLRAKDDKLYKAFHVI